MIVRAVNGVVKINQKKAKARKVKIKKRADKDKDKNKDKEKERGIRETEVYKVQTKQKNQKCQQSGEILLDETHLDIRGINSNNNSENEIEKPKKKK